MNTGKFVGIISLAALVSLGIGFAIGSSMCKRGTNAPNMSDLENKNVDELNVMLSDVMLPQDEFDKLSSAILQSAMGLFMAQAQGAGINVGDTATNELKNKIEAKYSRKYFSDINAESMKDLSKEELVAILSFYGTDAGQKFLKLSPEIIQKT
ncbi:MAG: DUF2059 domain-containing protein, partial [Myxococcales bacterium]|nr:DUF2059 domain-containing protein [Myxococcales bacterium]